MLLALIIDTLAILFGNNFTERGYIIGKVTYCDGTTIRYALIKVTDSKFQEINPGEYHLDPNTRDFCKTVKSLNPTR